MALTRADDSLTVTFRRAAGMWTEFEVEWVEDMDDGTHLGWQRIRRVAYPIADLPPAVQTDLINAWNGMRAHRESITPIE